MLRAITNLDFTFRLTMADPRAEAPRGVSTRKPGASFCQTGNTAPRLVSGSRLRGRDFSSLLGEYTVLISSASSEEYARLSVALMAPRNDLLRCSAALRTDRR
jgi:hypothetical protein